MRQRLEISRRFRFVQDEATAEMLDDELEDDVLVISRDFDLQALIEDELLMELPVAPRHEVCPQAPRMQVQTADFREEEAEKPNPFAALEALKKPKS
ncbi:YceD family protein [Brachymonas sp. G13]